jgi:PHP family Zn ribbon phosphoesterase
LQDLPGIGPKTYSGLLQVFNNEIDLMEQTPIEDILQVAGNKAAAAIADMRTGRLMISPGGGGKYGKVSTIK